MANEFAALLKELDAENELIAKAISDADGDQAALEAAAAAKGEKPRKKPAAGAGAADPDEDEAGAGDDDVFGKSFTVKLGDGTEVEAFDGTVAMRALADHNAELAAQVADLQKALTGSVALLRGMRTLQATQHDLIKSLQGEVAQIGAQGAGRKATISVHERPAAVPTEGAAPDGQALMTKAMSMFDAGQLTGSDVRRLEAGLLRGAPPAEIVAAVNAHRT